MDTLGPGPRAGSACRVRVEVILIGYRASAWPYSPILRMRRQLKIEIFNLEIVN